MYFNIILKIYRHVKYTRYKLKISTKFSCAYVYYVLQVFQLLTVDIYFIISFRIIYFDTIM